MEVLKAEKWLEDGLLCFDVYSQSCGAGTRSGSGLSGGDGIGFGFASGTGLINGSGHGSGGPYGDSSGSGIKVFNNMNVYIVDTVPTLITHIKRNLAKGFILQNDLTLTPCFVAKSQGYFAHGATVREAREALQCKIFRNMDTDDAIDKFLEKFKKGRKYSVKDFFEWHHILTGSCEQGRLAFMAEHDLSFDDKLTVSEFIALTRRSYGGEIIQRLKERIDSIEH